MDATAAGSQGDPSNQATPQDTAGSEPLSEADEQKRRFLEALEAKRGSAGRNGGATGDSKIHGTHGKAGAKRQFRRKSGG